MCVARPDQHNLEALAETGGNLRLSLKNMRGKFLQPPRLPALPVIEE